MFSHRPKGGTAQPSLVLKGFSREFLPSRWDKTQAWANIYNLLQEDAAENPPSQEQSLYPPNYHLLFYTTPAICPTMCWAVQAQGNKHPTQKNPTRSESFSSGFGCKHTAALSWSKGWLHSPSPLHWHSHCIEFFLNTKSEDFCLFVLCVVFVGFLVGWFGIFGCWFFFLVVWRFINFHAPLHCLWYLLDGLSCFFMLSWKFVWVFLIADWLFSNLVHRNSPAQGHTGNREGL